MAVDARGRDPPPQAITLVDDNLGIVAIALVEGFCAKGQKPTYMYIHAFAVRGDLRSLNIGSRFAGAILEIAAFVGFKAVIFTATKGDAASVPFWVKNHAQFLDSNIPASLRKCYLDSESCAFSSRARR